MDPATIMMLVSMLGSNKKPSEAAAPLPPLPALPPPIDFRQSGDDELRRMMAKLLGR